MNKTVKRIISFILLIALMMTLCSCGAKSELLGIKWIDIYTGKTLEFNKDGSFKLDESVGTWEQDENSISLIFSSDETGQTQIYYADLVKENDDMFIRTKSESVRNQTAVNEYCVLEFYPEKRASEIKKAITKNTDEIASTDIMEFTIKEAGLGFYANNYSYRSSGEITNIDSAFKPSTSDKLFQSSKGHCLIYIDFVIKNIDRTSLDTKDQIVDFIVLKDGNESFVNGYDLNNNDGNFGLDLSLTGIAENGGKFYKHTSTNSIISADETIEVKYVGVVGFEPQKTDGNFEIVVELKNSNDEIEPFVYSIN